MRIAFHSNQLGIQGTEVALYDYAHYNELLLHNTSFILSKNTPNNDPRIIDKFKSRFPVFLYSDFNLVDNWIINNQIDVLYMIKSGENDGYISKACKTVVHNVFPIKEPHGDVYAYVSEWTRDAAGAMGFPVVPHIMEFPKPVGNLRKELGIPENDIVFGCIGHRNAINIPFVWEAINTVVSNKENIWFLFVNVWFPIRDNQRIKFIPSNIDPQWKANFVSTCDAMIHGRAEGETQGIAIAEFSMQNKPVLMWLHGKYKGHISTLVEKGLYYSEKSDLVKQLMSFTKSDRNWNAFGMDYSPQVVMDKFNQVFLKQDVSINPVIGGIIGNKEIVMSENKSIFPLNNVAAYMMANEENAYIERIIRWLSLRVGKVFIVEGEKSFSGSMDRDLKVENLVKRLMNEGFNNVEYVATRYLNYTNPAMNETYMRNEAIEKIQRQGFEWVWEVDSDEVYSDQQAFALWKFFLEETKKNKMINGARCYWHTYWRSIHWRIDPPEPYVPNIIIKSDCRFSVNRALADERNIITIPKDICMVRHYSWAKPPSEIRKKIEGWGHAHQVLPGWYENVFSKWEPGCSMENLHPTEPIAYRKAIRCQLPMPELMKGHLYSDLDLIDCDDHSSSNIKVIILNHNKPVNADILFLQLSKAFDDVEIWDSGSDFDKIPLHLTQSFPNIYWTGAWNKIMEIYSDYDAVWMLGCDIELKSEPIEYRNAIEASLPFGCWSPCIEGRSHTFMKAEYYQHGEPISVKNIEGMAMAISGELMQKVKKLVEGSELGYGQDFWLCHMARKNGMKNIIDGRVKVFHPAEIGYDDKKALQQMNETFSRLYGDNFRNTIFEYDKRYEYNMIKNETPEKQEVLIPEIVGKKTLTVVTVDNGWGYAEFLRITANLPIRKIVMIKGAATLAPEQNVELIPYNSDISDLVGRADIALFPKVGTANKEEYFNLLKAGIPIVVHVAYHLGVVEHMKNSFYYQDESWAIYWINQLLSKPDMRKEVRKTLLDNPINPATVMNVPGCGSCTEKAKAIATQAPPLVTVITPTYKRDPKIIKRCIDCMILQTNPSWEQLVCSDGEEEEHAKRVVLEANDPRVVYHHTSTKKPGDFGNTVRHEMLQKARGRFVLFFDDDNIILPDYISQMSSVLENSPDCGFTVCKIMHFGPLNDVAGKPPIVLNGDPVKLYHIDPLQVLVKTDVMRKIGWDTEVGYLSDGVTLEKLGKECKHIRFEGVLGVHM